DALRVALAAAIRRLPARPPFLIGLRRLFKQAEMADDAGLFAATAHRFATASAMYATPEHSARRVYVPELQQALPVVAERARPDARVGLSVATLAYFKRRIWRTLRKRGEADDPAYAELAAAYLRALSPDDMARPVTRTHFARDADGAWRRVTCTSGPLSRNWPASQILSRHDADVRFRYGSLTTENAEGDGTARGEAFPALWDERPDLALDLAAESACEPVALFGVRRLTETPDALRALP
ncbi:hypothetical protein ACFQ4O_18060, partial [Methylopila musalis]